MEEAGEKILLNNEKNFNKFEYIQILDKILKIENMNDFIVDVYYALLPFL